MWDGVLVEVSGFPWLRGETKRIGIASLTSKVLCGRHNNALSPVDVAGAKAFRVFQEVVALADQIRNGAQPPSPPTRFEIPGELFERWALKTAVNLFLSNPEGLEWYSDGKPVSEIPPTLVRVAFGQGNFTRPMGLYGALDASNGMRQGVGGPLFRFSPLLYGGKVVGAQFLLSGYRFVLNLDQQPLPAKLEVDGQQPEWKANRLVYHVPRMEFTFGRQVTHYVDLTWPAQPAGAQGSQ
jgi:hypothetical protein